MSSPGNSSAEYGTSAPLTADRSAVAAWIYLVHPCGEAGYTDGLIHICSVGNWDGRTFSDPADAVDYVMRLDAEGAQGIYMRTTSLASVPKDYGRGSEADSKILPGFAADMDIAGPGHKTTKPLPTSPEQCRAIIAAANLPEPTLWVHSGGGVYPWWLLDEGLDIGNPDDLDWAKAISDQLHTVIARVAEHLGSFYGSGVKDMARVLRIPGTVNRKPGTEPRLAHIIQPASYEFYSIANLAEAVADAYAKMPKPAQPEIPRQAPAPRIEGVLSPGDDFNNRAHWADILVPHGWEYMYTRGRTVYWRRPGKDTPGHSATTGRNGTGAEDRLFVMSEDAHPFKSSFSEGNKPYNKHAAYTLLNHGGLGSAHFASSTSDLRSQGFGGELPKLNRAVDLTSLVRPAAVPAPVAQQPMDDQQPEQTALAVQANQALPVLTHDGLPSFTSDVYGTQHWDEMGLVSMYSSTFCPALRYVNAVDEWRIWDGQRWTRDDKQRYQLASRTLLTGLLDHARRLEAQGAEGGKEMVKKAQSLATMSKVMQLPKLARTDSCMTSAPSEYDRHRDLVTVDNGVLNLRTGELADFDPELMLTKKLSVKFDPDALGPRTTKFLEGIQPDPAMRTYMKRLAGYTLLGNADERVLPIVYGKSGSGKSAFLEMLYHTLGDFGSIADPSTLMPLPDGYQGPSEKLHSLMHARFVKMSELPENAALNQALVKSITGSDTQKTRPLYGPLVEWQVEYTVWMATNNLPKITSTDDAIWKRVKPIHFPNVFVNEDGSVKNAADKDLGRQLAREEGSFILNWLLEGIREYLEFGLQEPGAIKDGVGEYRDDMDTVRQFMTQAQEDGRIKTGEGQTITARDLYEVYMAWARDAQVRFPLSNSTFKQRMLANGYEQHRVAAGLVWKGIGIAGFVGQAKTSSANNQWMGRMRN